MTELTNDLVCGCASCECSPCRCGSPRAAAEENRQLASCCDPASCGCGGACDCASGGNEASRACGC